MKTPRHILALDQGTTSSRAIVFDQKGRAMAEARKEFRQYYPRPGWVEHDPLEIWSSQSATAAEAIARADLSVSDILGIGLTNQRETTIVWDRETGRPVYPAIVWQDRRTADFCAQLKGQGAEAFVTERTGLRLDPYFSATKVRWILDNVNGARRRAEDGRLMFGTVDTWLIWQFTGRKVHATDATNASRTLLYNLRTGDWDDELLRLFDVPRSLLPEIRSCAEIYGTVHAGFHPAGVPIAGVAGDQHAALFGQACFEPGMAKNTYGTGCFTLMNTGERPKYSTNNLLTTLAWKLNGKTEYALKGAVFVGGAVVQWLRDELRLVRDAREVDELAASVRDAGGVFFVPAFAGLGAPHWDPYARGAMFGITRGTNRAHICRAALESIAFQTADLIACMERDSGIKLAELRVDGGASQSAPLLQFQSDLLRCSVVRPRCVETTAMGVAFFAGLTMGMWTDCREIAGLWESEVVFEPEREITEVVDLRRGWANVVRRIGGSVPEVTLENRSILPQME